MRDDQIEYVTVWNGVNDGRDGDHLVAGRLDFKREAPPLRHAPSVNQPKLPIDVRNRNAVIFALSRATEPLSVATLAFEAGVTGNTVRRVLAPLIAAGQVTVGRQRSTYRAHLSVYRLVSSQPRAVQEGAAA